MPEMQDGKYVPHYGVDPNVATGAVTRVPEPANSVSKATSKRKTCLSGREKPSW